MIPELRRAYNRAFAEERYLGMLRDLEAEIGFPIDFRVSETPLFLTADMTRELQRAAWDILGAVTLARAGGGPTALYTTIAVTNVVGLVVMLPVAVRLVRRRATEEPAEAVERAGSAVEVAP